MIYPFSYYFSPCFLLFFHSLRYLTLLTTASLHDSQVDLSIPGIPCYKDKGYAGAYCKDINATMDKASREHPLTVEKIRRNLRITRKCSPGERPYSVMKGIMNGGHTLVTMVRRCRVKAMFLCLGYNDHGRKSGWGYSLY